MESPAGCMESPLGVWHHASASIHLRIDYIQHFVLIPYRRQAADSIHGFAVILRVAFLSKPQAWHIIAAQSAVHIISPFGAVSHHAIACIKKLSQ